jgi:hypothetical protein
MDDLRQVIREIGRVYHFLGKDKEADYCKSLVKQLRRGSTPARPLPGWLCEAISRGFGFLRSAIGSRAHECKWTEQRTTGDAMRPDHVIYAT